MKAYQFSDFHCHPNLKTFGQSFGNPKSKLSDLWHYNPPCLFTKIFNALTGLSKFSQADFTSMSKGNVRIAFVSFYPFEKNYFINEKFSRGFSARLANLITGVGYERIRFIQSHLDYLKDLENEMKFFLSGIGDRVIDGAKKGWRMAKNWKDISESMNSSEIISVIPTIEGAHVLNTGLGNYGRQTSEEHVLSNIEKLKSTAHPPFFITFAHNFNNDLCGHAPSFHRANSLLNQEDGLNEGISELGRKAIGKLLDTTNSKRPVYIDVKHMSVAARKEYYLIIKEEYGNGIPVIVSHGAATGTSWRVNQKSKNNFCNDPINFYDEEFPVIASTGGIFALQMDGSRLAEKRVLRKNILQAISRNAYKYSARIIWNQLQHIAEVLDARGLPAWNTCNIGSDFDGTINPLNGLWSAENFPLLAEELESLAKNYLRISNNHLILTSNKSVQADELVHKFTIGNSIEFLKKYFI